MTDVYSPQERSAIMRAVKTAKTTPEVILRRELHRQGFRFARSHKGRLGKPDLVLPKFGAVIFVNGCFWHGHDCPRATLPKTNARFWRQKIGRNKDRDHHVTHGLSQDGWRVFTVWQCEVATATKRAATVKRLTEQLRTKDGNGRQNVQGN